MEDSTLGMKITTEGLTFTAKGYAKKNDIISLEVV